MHSSEMRLRLTQLGYDDKLSKEEIIEKVKRIYLEETGKKLKADIQVYTSKEARVGEKSGYDGIAIYLDSKENKKDELYVISQGSKDIKDWDYNIKAMLAGKDIRQAKATNKFVKATQGHFNLNKNEDSTSIIGLSHSLAHNNNTTAYLLYDTFDEIYSVNGAQTNYYQLYNANLEFRETVQSKFSISPIDPNAVYDIDPNKLRQFAEAYYKDNAKNIHQIISEDDPLYAVSVARGFFTLGNVEIIDTNHDYPGLRSLIEDIPDEVIKDFQELAIQYTTASNQGGIKTVMHDILGVNMDVVNKMDNWFNSLKAYATYQPEIDTMIRQLDKKLPGVLKRVKTITSNADLMFGRLVMAGYISNSQKQVIVKEFTNIETELDGIRETLSRLVGVRETGNFFVQIGGDIAAIVKIMGHITAIQDSLEVLKREDLLSILEEIKASHSITEVLSSLSSGKKSYLGSDMVFSTKHGKKEIKVNISAALRMYQNGKAVLEEKLSEIDHFQAAIHREISQCYENNKSQVMRKIDDIEANPGLYSYLLRKHIYFSRLNKKVKRIRVYEVFFPLETANLNEEIHVLRKSIEKGYMYVENYRKAIEDLFAEEKEIGNLFDLVGGE